eukprot:jgi/Botrbrau1/21193/Bobra.0431s0002.1
MDLLPDVPPYMAGTCAGDGTCVGGNAFWRGTARTLHALQVNIGNVSHPAQIRSVHGIIWVDDSPSVFQIN